MPHVGKKPYWNGASRLSDAADSTPTIADEIAERTERKRQAKQTARHVRLYMSLLESQAWNALTDTEARIYIEFCKVYNGANNGRIGMSTRDLQRLRKVSAGTATRALAKLQEVGLIRLVKAGIFTRSAETRRAAEWRLTDYKCNVTGAPPTREWRRWKPSDRSTREAVPLHPESTTAPPRKHAAIVANQRSRKNRWVDRSTKVDDRSTREAHIELTYRQQSNGARVGAPTVQHPAVASAPDVASSPRENNPSRKNSAHPRKPRPEVDEKEATRRRIAQLLRRRRT
jgi:hypothetical protein